MIVLTFLAVALTIVAIYSLLDDLYLRERALISQRLSDEFRQHMQERAKRSILFKDLAKMTDQGLNKEPKLNLREKCAEFVDQSGLNISLSSLAALMAGIGLTVGLAAGTYQQSPIIGLVAGLVAGALPVFYVHYKRKALQAKLREQLPEAFDLMARTLHAGQSMTQALHSVASQFPPPIATEFSYCFEQQKLGLPAAVALRDLSRRNGLLELKIFVMAMLVQQEAGGNLANLLEKLATVMRERFRIQGKIRALTAEGRLQALILLALPPFILGVLMVVNRTYAQVLLHQPKLLVLGGIAMLIGALWIRKIVNFEI